MGSNNKEIRKFIDELSHDEFTALLNSAMKSEEWGQILSGHVQQLYVGKVKADLHRLQFIPNKIIESDKTVAQFVAIATERVVRTSK